MKFIVEADEQRQRHISREFFIFAKSKTQKIKTIIENIEFKMDRWGWELENWRTNLNAKT